MIPERNQKYNFNNQRQNKKYNYNTYVQLQYKINDDDDEIHRVVQKSTAYTWLDCCCFNAAQIVLTPPAPRNGGPFLPFFGQAGQVDPLVGWRSCY